MYTVQCTGWIVGYGYIDMYICLSCIQCVIQEDITNKCVLQKPILSISAE